MSREPSRVAPTTRPTRRSFLVASGAGLASLAGCLRTAGEPATPGFLDGVTNVAHQGGDLLRPGNTLLAFEHAVAVGADVLEMDLWLSADDEIVVIHDATVDRTTDGGGRVDEHTLAELKALDAAYNWSPPDADRHPYRGEGVEIPTLEEVLEAFPEMPLLLEPKHESVPPARLVEFLERHDRLDDVVLAAFEDATVREARELAPDVPTGIGPKEGRAFVTTTRPNEPRYEPEGEVLFPPYEIVDGTVIQQAHRVGLEVVPWTVNDRSAMERLVDAGADGIITDDPETMAAVVADSGSA